ncbi:hypothetical protein JBKA6_1100 [Ichthyobacterium seriolicida]|uniref:Uncharacterized protein n=1 Tax=Ichthyobacterium seriolicida TaxID=242600 RepID=A0A1J1DYY5_9FLAO|nr:hypothetical protein JBKA6_1100 [Ichthyobacterium seriolicida]
MRSPNILFNIESVTFEFFKIQEIEGIQVPILMSMGITID